MNAYDGQRAMNIWRHERGVVVAIGLPGHEDVERRSLIRGQSGDEVLDQCATPTVRRQRPERIEGDEPGRTLGVGDRDVHPEMRAPGVADQPGAVPAEVVEHGDRVGDVDVARPGERARLESALLGQDTVDQAVELLDEADEPLRTDARAAMEEQCRWTLALAAPGREDLAAGDGHGQAGEPHRLLRVRTTVAHDTRPRRYARAIPARCSAS